MQDATFRAFAVCAVIAVALTTASVAGAFVNDRSPLITGTHRQLADVRSAVS